MQTVTPETPTPNGRLLFSAGKWLVPESERPADWREREQPKEMEPPKPKPEHRYVGGTPRGFKPGHPRYGGKKKGQTRVEITAAEIVARREAGETTGQIAVSLKCAPSLLWKRLKTAGVLPAAKVCVDCHKPTGRARNAKRCSACAKIAKAGWKHKLRQRIAALPEVPTCVTVGCTRRGLVAKRMCSRCYQIARKAGRA